MWTKSRLSHYVEHVRKHRQFEWSLFEYKKNREVCTEAGVTPEGWILFELCDKSFEYGKYRYSHYLMLTEGERVVQTYTITFDEFNDFPTMPPGWNIPF